MTFAFVVLRVLFFLTLRAHGYLGMKVKVRKWTPVLLFIKDGFNKSTRNDIYK